ncbi:hypothetical protein [Streptomyces collinus]
MDQTVTAAATIMATKLMAALKAAIRTSAERDSFSRRSGSSN